MICSSCSLDCTVTVLYAWTFNRIDSRGRETTEHRHRRLCLRCGGADGLVEAEPVRRPTPTIVLPQPRKQ